MKLTKIIEFEIEEVKNVGACPLFHGIAPLYLTNPDDSLTGVAEDDGTGEEKGGASPLREQDRFLPIANVARIMKDGIPKTGKVQYLCIIW